jgi:hypothetical protein
VIYTKNIYNFALPPGAYRYTITSGAGAGNANGQTGGLPVTRNSISGSFIWHGGNIDIRIGGDGFNGGNGGGGGFSQNGFGGGSGAGEESEIVGIIKTRRINAGESGSGRKEGFGGYGDPINGDPIRHGQGGGYGFGGGGNSGSSDLDPYLSGGGGSGDLRGIGPGGGGYGGNRNYGSNGNNGGSSNHGGGGGGGGAPGWQRNMGDAGGSISLWQLW